MKRTLYLQNLLLTGAALMACLIILEPKAISHPDGHTASATGCQPVTFLTPFVDPLPIPPTAVSARTLTNYLYPFSANLIPSIPVYDILMTNFQHQFHRDIPSVEVWGYGFATNGGYAATYPGPTIETVVNSPILVNWMNRLPTNYPAWLPANTNLHGVHDQSVRTVVHLHGGATLPRFDGYPTNWFRTGESDLYFYGNIDFNDDGETLWYHDHAEGVTANNVYAGLAGFYLLRNPAIETNANLPSGAYEIPLVIQDRDIQTNSSLSTNLLFDCATTAPLHYLAVVNGKVTPYLTVEPRPYRFRILNGANFRTFGLTLSVVASNGVPFLTNAPTPPVINVIGNEDGFLQQTVPTSGNPNLTMMPGERVDVIIDFTKFQTNYITLGNTLFTAVNAPIITNLMQFRVSASTNTNSIVKIPTNIVPNWVATSNLVTAAGTNVQLVTLDLANETPFPGLAFSATNAPFALLNMAAFANPITEKPRAGQTQMWAFVNLTQDAHPMHLHLLDFRVVDRRRFIGFDGNPTNPPTGVTNFINDRKNGLLTNLTYTLLTNKYLSVGTTIGLNYQVAQPFESGPKDVVRAAPFSVTRIVMVWPTNVLFYSTPSAINLDPGTRGRYLYHCHLLEHEDDDMMRPFQLLGPASLSLRAIFDSQANATGRNQIRLRLDTILGETYRIESSLDLKPASWQPQSLGDISGTGGVFEFTPPASLDPYRFYRARRVNPP